MRYSIVSTTRMRHERKQDDDENTLISIAKIIQASCLQQHKNQPRTADNFIETYGTLLNIIFTEPYLSIYNIGSMCVTPRILPARLARTNHL